MTRRFLVLLTVVGFAAGAMACLRDSADARAVQWSTAIVKANHQGHFQFEVTESFDGPMKTGSKFQLSGEMADTLGNCHQKIGNDSAGKSFVLLLRKSDKNEGFNPVYVMTSEEADENSITDLKQLITETRKAEADVTDEQIKTQVDVLVHAQDDTEAEHAEDALREIGPKCLPAMKAALAKADETGKRRLNDLIKDLAPPEPKQ